MLTRLEVFAKDLYRSDRLIAAGSHALPSEPNRIVEFVSENPTSFFDNTPPADGNVAVFLTSINPTRDRWDVPKDLRVTVDRPRNT